MTGVCQASDGIASGRVLLQGKGELCGPGTWGCLFLLKEPGVCSGSGLPEKSCRLCNEFNIKWRGFWTKMVLFCVSGLTSTTAYRHSHIYSGQNQSSTFFEKGPGDLC